MTKHGGVVTLCEFGVPCAPVMPMKESANCPSPRKSETIVEVDYKVHGMLLVVGSPIKLSDMIKFSDMEVRITVSPPPGEHANEVAAEMYLVAERGYTPERIAKHDDARAVRRARNSA